MFTSAVIFKQSLLHENEIVQLLHNHKCSGVDQSRFRKPLQSSHKNIKATTLKRPVHSYRLSNL